MFPRIRGKVGQAQDPEEMKGKWFFELWMSTHIGEGVGESMGKFGPWETEAIAKSELEKMARLAVEAIEKNMADGKTNKVRTWDETK
ncbi:MAG: hypothetical protein HQK50_09275 [Oligoflexia bacterium]|nr:hypothetical protein [Oligoflexia bacterium]